MDKQNTAHACNDILSDKKEWATDTLNSSAKCKNQSSKNCIHSDSIYMTVGKSQKLEGQHLDQWWARGEGKYNFFQEFLLAPLHQAPPPTPPLPSQWIQCQCRLSV